MGINKTGPTKGGKAGVSHKNKCWHCNRPAAAFAVNVYGQSVCQQCEPRLFEGIIETVNKSAKTTDA